MSQGSHQQQSPRPYAAQPELRLPRFAPPRLSVAAQGHAPMQAAPAAAHRASAAAPASAHPAHAPSLQGTHRAAPSPPTALHHRQHAARTSQLAHAAPPHPPHQHAAPMRATYATATPAPAVAPRVVAAPAASAGDSFPLTPVQMTAILTFVIFLFVVTQGNPGAKNAPTTPPALQLAGQTSAVLPLRRDPDAPVRMEGIPSPAAAQSLETSQTLAMERSAATASGAHHGHHAGHGANAETATLPMERPAPAAPAAPPVVRADAAGAAPTSPYAAR